MKIMANGLLLVQKSSEYSSSLLKPGDFTRPGSFFSLAAAEERWNRQVAAASRSGSKGSASILGGGDPHSKWN